ncbi:conserved hypothetical protein [Methanothermobacter sp. CaT2]|uniref:Uncharacterized protein n=1 Tax=Methanothermobacter thermautotrophicus (strain ATCC 29096 / DSM 1053 / JCM 10044 / NBRC 100330 / Delta H) TaxID=187420 RepID=O26627_METTH|nr:MULTISPECIES: hypothetical protein [Methanothermobacter]AAB85033.1 unknown [Methanothermobacter thermautotrophicus str. Delta H]MDI6817845.1 hypothetical protein [Methanothermobacter thermautotrophicus]WBF06790.1 hypothetical protein ISG35_02440 [Methanothermobacter thermautotrophicus]WBF08583.1 hypothetical protein ISG36_02470 [Methanothermobacter thermautotrophicus]BAM69702.1 conserved hypothetical protein [Methanothermobacter sp. CaT2]
MVETKTFRILEDVADLEEKIKKYEGEADQELVINWIYDTLEILRNVGKLLEEVEDRLDLLEEETEEKKF